MNNLLKLMCIGVMFSGMALADVDGQPLVYGSSGSQADSPVADDGKIKGFGIN